MVCISVIVIYLLNISTDMSTLIENSLSKQYEENKQIKIFDTYEISDYKIVGFTLVGSEKCGFAVLRQYGNSGYELISVTRYEQLTKRALDIFVKYIDLYDEKHKVMSYLVVLSLNAELSKIKMTIDDGEPIYREINSNPSLTVIEFPDEPFMGEYLFYDKSGNLIR